MWKTPRLWAESERGRQWGEKKAAVAGKRGSQGVFVHVFMWGVVVHARPSSDVHTHDSFVPRLVCVFCSGDGERGALRPSIRD